MTTPANLPNDDDLDPLRWRQLQQPKVNNRFW
jgi:hypothetical protein